MENIILTGKPCVQVILCLYLTTRVYSLEWGKYCLYLYQSVTFINFVFQIFLIACLKIDKCHCDLSCIFIDILVGC